MSKTSALWHINTKCAHEVVFCTCSVDNINRGVQDTRVNPDRCGWPGKFDSNTLYGFKNIRIRVDGVSSLLNYLELFNDNLISAAARKSDNECK